MLIFLTFFYIFCCVCVESVFYKSNVTDLSKCQVYYSRSGSVYKDFFDISAEEDASGNGTYVLDFHFAVLAPSDAHILLAPSPEVGNDDPAYEVVIGAGGNTFCDIRRRRKHDVKASVRIKGLLSALDPNFFWLHITKDGVIEVGKEGDELAFISWIDPDILPLKVFSFSTWSGIEAKWYFNCDRKNSAEELEKKMTDLDKLRKDLLEGYDPYVRPVLDSFSIITVDLAFYLGYISLNEHRSTIDIQGSIKMKWQDEKLKWDPETYNGIENLHIFRREIWHPDLTVFNAVDNGADLFQDTMMVADYTGIVQWAPPVTMTAWCDANTMGAWPRDAHACSILLMSAKNYNVKFEVNESSQSYPDDWEWEVLQLEMSSDVSDFEFLQINVTVRRISRFYDTVFSTPFLVIAVCQLSTFWSSPNGQTKISLGCTQMVLCTIILAILGTIVPSSEKVPYFLTLYSYALLGTLISIILSIIIINLVRTGRGSPPRFISFILTSRYCSICFCLSDLEVDNYGKLDTSIEKNQFLWIQIGVIIDRIAFVVYLSLIIYAIVIGRL